MNLFILDYDPTIAAKSLVNLHVSKMLTEASQVIGTALSINGYEIKDKYLASCPIHRNHPTVVSASKSLNITIWLLEHAYALSNLYTSVTGKTHGSLIKVQRAENLVLDYIPDTDTSIKDLMPACSVFNTDRGSIVDRYRKFYLHDKLAFSDWGRYGNIKPEWFSPDYHDLDIRLAWQMTVKRNKSRKNKITYEHLVSMARLHGWKVQ